MMENLIAILIGILLGIISGITPGLHVNTIGVIIFSFSEKLLNYTNPLTLSIFFVSLAMCHAMMEFIPSLLIGIPSEDTILSIQPGHKMLFKGEGKKAIRLISFGGFVSIIILIFLMPLLIIFLPMIYNLLKEYIGYFLVITMIILLIRFNRKETRLKSILLFLVSGILGLVVLNSNVGNNLGLLAMLSGLFSISSLIFTINSESKIPPQKDNKSIVIDYSFLKSAFAGSISGCILGLLPGLGPAHGTIIAQCITLNRNIKTEEFLITNSGVNISDTLFSLIALYLINNPRSAISVYIGNILTSINFIHILLFISVSLITVAIVCVISIKIGDYMIENMIKLDYKKLNLFIIILITCIIIILTVNANGCLFYVLLCYITSTALGLIANISDLSKSNLMGVLIIPSMITYLGLL